MKENDLTKQLDRLQKLLQKQKELTGAGSFIHLEDLLIQSGKIVDNIKDRNIDKIDEPRRQKILSLYKELILRVETEKAKLGSQIDQLKKAGSTMAAYKRSADNT